MHEFFKSLFIGWLFPSFPETQRTFCLADVQLYMMDLHSLALTFLGSQRHLSSLIYGTVEMNILINQNLELKG